MPSETAQAVGFDAESSESRGFLKQLLVALDAQNSRAARRCPPGEWRSPESLSSSGTAWSTARPGAQAREFYVCVVGADGST
ncbi:MAG: hypothetical protein ACLTMP_11445 [Eggerthella lenta]